MKYNMIKARSLATATLLFGSLVGGANGAIIAGNIDSFGYSGSVELLSTTYSFSFDIDENSTTGSDTFEATFSPFVTSSSSFLRGTVNNASAIATGGTSRIDHYFRRGSLGGTTGYRSDAVFGSDNYLLVDLNRNGTFETVLQYDFNSAGRELVSILTSSDDSSIDISGGIASVEAVPEPSSSMLLGLAGLGLTFRRSRR